MKHNKLIKEAVRLAEPFCITDGEKFRLKDYDPADTNGVKNKQHAQNIVDRRVGLLSDMQEKLYAQDRWALLVILQAMDAAGKDGVIKHVMSGVNPQACQVYSFKSPSAEDLDHDYLWRCMKSLPNRGHIGIFNRSYYEEVLIVRVHPAFLVKQSIPPPLVGKEIWAERFEDIRNFEQYLGRNGVVVRKFFLHVSKKEQKRRFLERIDDPMKNWKFSSSDTAERDFWDKYMEAYEEMIRETATKDAPWYVVPADNKWFTRVIVAAAVIEALADLDLAYPKLDAKKTRELAAAKTKLSGRGR
jgi:PPK2 family polyphosphate:nucleotide phosphotransferase